MAWSCMKQVSSVAVDAIGLNPMLNYESKCLVFGTELLLTPFASSTNPAFVVKCCSPARAELWLHLLYSKIGMKYKGTCRETSIPSCKLVQLYRQTCKNVKDNSRNSAQASSTSSQFQILVWFHRLHFRHIEIWTWEEPKKGSPMASKSCGLWALLGPEIFLFISCTKPSLPVQSSSSVVWCWLLLCPWCVCVCVSVHVQVG